MPLSAALRRRSSMVLQCCGVLTVSLAEPGTVLPQTQQRRGAGCAWALHQCAVGGGASRAGWLGSPFVSLVAGALLSSGKGGMAAASPVLGGGAAEGMAGSAATETKQAVSLLSAACEKDPLVHRHVSSDASLSVCRRSAVKHLWYNLPRLHFAFNSVVWFISDSHFSACCFSFSFCCRTV